MSLIEMKSTPRRVLFFMPSLAGGGAERVIVTLLRHLDRARFEPHLALVKAAGPLLKEVPADVPVHDLKAGRVRYVIPSMVRLVRKLQPQVVHTSMPELNISSILCRPFYPPQTRVLIREDISTSAHNLQLGRNPRIWAFLYRLYGKADKIICVADFVLNDLAENYSVPRSKLVRIYNPVDVSEARTLADAGENPYLGNGPHVVAAGRLSNQKGFDILLDAMALVHNSLPNSQLTILGEGDLRSELLAQRDRLRLNETVHLPGFVSSPFLYFKHADLFVLPSRFEGLPLVVLEALAVGTPVVASDCPGGLREILEDCPVAWLAPPGSPEALAETIVSVCHLDLKRPQTSAREDAFISRFDVKTVVRAYEDLLLS